MERKVEWLPVAVLVLKALLAGLAAITADQALTGGQVSRAVGQAVDPALGAQLPVKPASWLRLSNPQPFELASLSVLVPKSLRLPA